MDIAAFVTDALRDAGHPVVSVRTPVLDDRSTWVVQLVDGATPDQQAAADAFLSALTVSPEALADKEIAVSMFTLDYAVMIVYLAQMQGKTRETVQTELAAIARQVRQEQGM